MRREVTEEMILSARRFGWSGSKAANFFGFHHTSIYRKAEKMGVVLVNQRLKSKKSRTKEYEISIACNRREKRWSASPAAVERAAAALGV